jgi:hypothetical protein
MGDGEPQYRPRGEDPRRQRQQGESLLSQWYAGPDARSTDQLSAWTRFMQEPHSDRAVEAAIEWLGRTWGDARRCPYCDTAGWEVGPVFGIGHPPREFLAFPVTCANCGSTTLIDAVHAGVVPQPDG